MTYIKLTYNNTEYLVPATGVTVGMQNNVFSETSVNGSSVSEVQTQSFTNPLYNIQGVHFTGVSGTLTYGVLLSMLKHKYDGTNEITLEVRYGDSTDLVGSDGLTTVIPVVVKSFNFPILTTDSQDGYMPVGTIQLLETK